MTDPRYTRALAELDDIVARNPHLAWGNTPREEHDRELDAIRDAAAEPEWVRRARERRLPARVEQR